MNTPEHSPKTHCRTDETKRKLIARLRRIEGQTRALQQMIADDRACIDILRLINSVTGALRGVWSEVLNDHLKGCIRESLERKDTHLLNELTDLLKKSR
ncbi:MAG: metal-sensitive transcriptional regulator [Opitutales bacterium]|nr:metal-sensitive transcriptional regulator [Opitutales bacterium]